MKKRCLLVSPDFPPPLIGGSLVYISTLVENSNEEFDIVTCLNTQDRAELLKSMDIGVKGGWESIAEARQAVGLPTNESHNIYLRSLQWEQTSADQQDLAQDYEGDESIDEEPQPFDELND